MKEIIYNNDGLTENDITETVIRTKALIINDDKIILGNENSIYQFPGGHLDDGESLKDCLKREILEETGIDIEICEIKKPFMKVTFLNKDWPEQGKNRKSEIYYYAIITDKSPNLEKINLTEHEKENNFKLEKVLINDAIKVIKENIPNNKKNEVIAPDMIIAIEEFFKQN